MLSEEQSNKDEIKTETLTKEEEAQREWELESKRIQEIKNPKEPEPVVESTPEPVVEMPEPEPELPEIIVESQTQSNPTEINSAALLETVSEEEVNSRISFEEFTDERTLISHDAFGNKQMKIKVLEVSDENPTCKMEIWRPCQGNKNSRYNKTSRNTRSRRRGI